MKEYLPEWKIYLWKKLLLDQSSPDKIFQPTDFMYFGEEDEKKFLLKDAQRGINRVRQYPYRRMQSPYSRAVPIEHKIEIDSGTEIPSSDRYYKFEIRRVMLALIELATEEPKCLDINGIELRKSYLEGYRREHERLVALDARRHIASLGAGGGSRKPDNRPIHPFCGLPKHIYEKAEKGDKLTLLELNELVNLRSDAAFYSHIAFKMKIDKKSLHARLDAYIADFVTGELLPPPGVRFFKFEQQKGNVLKAIQSLGTKYGSTNMPITFEEVSRSGGWIYKDEHHYRFYETIFSLEKMGEIEIRDLRKEEVVLSLIEKPVIEKEKTALVKELSSADRKKLFILEKLKEEWDLAPKNVDPVKIKIAGNRVHQWMNELGVDYYQLETILMSFEVENLIIKYESVNPAM